MNGRIVKALSGFYYVEAADGIHECRARGIFRKQGQTPLVGDLVEFSLSGKRGTVEAIGPRRNRFVRPAVSNVDLLVLLAAACNPVTDPFLLDRVLAIAAARDVPCLICVNKCDIDPGDELAGIYERAGFDVLRTSAVTGRGVEDLRQHISGKTAVFTGNSGVGKSSLLNALAPDFGVPTAEVSEKLEDLQYAFPDFAPFLGSCRFQDCAHLREPDCAVTAALARGEIEPTRYRSYERLYEQAKEYKQWEIKQP